MVTAVLMIRTNLEVFGKIVTENLTYYIYIDNNNNNNNNNNNI